MSTPQPQTNPTSRHFTAPCQDCKTPLQIPHCPAYFLHSNEVSTVVMPHENAIVCGHCGAIYGLGINEALTKIHVKMTQVKKGSLIASPHSNGDSGLILPS